MNVDPNGRENGRWRNVSLSTLALAVAIVATAALAALTLPSLLGPTPDPTPVDVVFATPSATPSASVAPSGQSPSASPDLASPSATSTLSDAVPTRVVVANLKIDLPIVRPKPDEIYPLCDVAEYLTYFSVPGLPGVTYVYAHAQKGMFLPLLDASLVDDGNAMHGLEVLVYTNDDLLRTYEIRDIHRHTHNLSLAESISGDALVLQTSETGYDSGSKLTIVARQVGVPTVAIAKDAHPRPTPRVCGP